MTRVFTLFACLLGFSAVAQNQVTGVVADAATGEPLAGVSIFEVGTSNGVFTMADGTFSISLSANTAQVQFAYLGYETVTWEYSGQPTIDVMLQPDVRKLGGLVVTALGIERERKELGYAVTQIEGEELTLIREPNLVNAFAGKAAGIQISNGSSGVGSSSRIVIRGESSFSGSNQPLFVVDGMPISNDVVSNLTENLEGDFQEVDYGNGAAELSSDDIKSISILKGPGAAALYGTRAANGVVVIKTKDGTGKKGIHASFNSSFTLETPLTLPQLQNVYGGGTGGKFAYEDGLGGGVNDGGITSFGPKMDEGNNITQFDSPSTDANGNTIRGGDIVARNGNPIEATPWVSQPNNVSDFFKTGVTYQNQLAVSASGENGSVRLSYFNLDNSGIIPNTDLTRNSVSVSSSYKMSERLKARTFVNYINSSSTNRPALGYGSENPMYLFTWMGRQNNLESLEDYWQAGQENFRQFNYNYQWMDNPYFTVFENTNGFDKDRLLGNVNLSYALSEHLSIRLKSGVDYYHDLRTSKRAMSSQRYKNGGYREDEVEFRETNTDVLLSYTRKWGKWNGMFGAGGNRMNQQTDYKGTMAGELSVPGIYNFGNSKIPLVLQQQQAAKRINSLYALGRFNYNAQWFFDLTFRNDWSSTLPSDQNSFAYYSGAVSAILSDMLVLPRQISYAKLRMSAASVGNDTDPFQLQNTFTFNQNYGSFPLLSSPTTLLNANLRPERLNALEAGTEIWLFNDVIGLDASVYQNTSSDQIVRLPVSAASGYTSRLVNGGKVQSQGIELALNARLFSKKKFKWTAFGTFTRNVSKVVELPEGINQYVTGYASVYNSTQNTVFFIADPENGRMGDMYGTGFETVDGEILYDENGFPIRSGELTLLGNYNPDFMVGFGNEFSYKNLSFGFLFDWRQGGEVVSRMMAIGSTSGVLDHTLEGREDGVVGDGVVNVGTESEPRYEQNETAISAQNYYQEFYNRANETSSVFDASYLKLRQVSLTYQLPKKAVEKMHLSGLSISIIGSNLWLLTENPHFDPELNAMQGRNFVQGVEDMSYPSTRSFGFSLKAQL